jgi:carboxyl-terminal processing protease
MNASVREYVNQVLDVAEEGFIYTQQVNWPEVRAQVIEQCTMAVTTLETHAALRWMADHLNSFLEVPHTFFRSNRAEREPGELTPVFEPPHGEQLEADIGYIWMPHVINEADSIKYPNVLQGVIAAIDTNPTRAWIVDLRDNDGGNCWPMLAGIGPILGEGVCGAFENSTGKRFEWAYQNGSSLIDSEVHSSVMGAAYRLKHEHTPVAVLIGPNTASAAEVVAIAFKGRTQVRFFGLASCGASTGNNVNPFEDGAYLVLTRVHELDRTGHRYGHPMQPDEIVADGWNLLEPQKDACVQRAIDWFKTQP